MEKKLYNKKYYIDRLIELDTNHELDIESIKVLRRYQIKSIYNEFRDHKYGKTIAEVLEKMKE